MLKRFLPMLLTLTICAGVIAIEWRDTDDEVKTAIAGPTSTLTWQFKDIMADRRNAEQAERTADALERIAFLMEFKVTQTFVSYPLNLNTASQMQLMTVHGIGMDLAGQIVENQPFGAVEDLLLIPGITQELLDTWKWLLTVSE